MGFLRQSLLPRGRAATPWFLLALVVLVPRVLRLLHPRLWAEDEQFAMAAELVRSGAKPYHDFVHVNPPVLEWGLAGWFELFGTSLLACEVLTAIVVALTSLLIFSIVRPASFLAGVLAALLHATSALVFRYHVFEREIFTTFLIALAWFLARRAGWVERKGRALAVLLVLVAAALCKLTAGLSILAFFAWTLLRENARLRVVGLLASTALAITAALFVLTWRYGEAFLLQNFVFALAKGTNVPSLEARATFLVAQLEPVFLFALPTLVLLLGTRVPDVLRLAGLTLVLEVGSKALLKPALWAHNLIPALLPASVLAGFALAQIVTRRGVFASRWRTGFLVVGAVLLAVPWWNHALRKTPGAARPEPSGERVLLHGFGGASRSSWRELERVARPRLEPGELVLATSDWVPLVLGARPLLGFWETEPAWLELRRAHAEGRLWEHVRAQRGKTFEQRQAETFPLAAERVMEAWRAGRLRYLVSPDGLSLAGVLGLPAEEIEVPGTFRLERLVPPRAGHP